MTDQTIREQNHHYFLQEAPELMQVLEQDLLSLREDYTINKINNLMRTTHTLKGAAASVGLETIKTVAHSLEDIFKALFNPELSIDEEIEALLFEGYECLLLPITAQLTGGQVNDAKVLDRTAAIFALLQEKLGDCFGKEAHIPSSLELGFDVTQSIFEVGVTQRLEEIAVVISSADPVAIASTLRIQAEVFQGLAESLNLPGLEMIAQYTIAALDHHPDACQMIAQTALADFQAAQVAVLNGDRISGGQPSLALQQLSGLDTPIAVENSDFSNSDFEPTPHEEPLVEAPDLPTLEVEAYAVPPIQVNSESLDQTNSERSFNADDQELVNQSLEEIWGGKIESFVPEDSTFMPMPEPEIENWTEKEPENTVLNSSPEQPEVTVNPPLSSGVRIHKTSSPTVKKDPVAMSETVRVDVEHLEHLNYSIGELLTNQNRQSLQNEQIRVAVRGLITRLQQHQQQLSQLQNWSDRQFNLLEQRQYRDWGLRNRGQGSSKSSWQSPIPSSPKFQSQFPIPTERFDSLELDRYSEAQLIVQSILEDTVQLAEATDAIDLFTRASSQTLEKQRRLLTSTRDTLRLARMMPLGEIFGRCQRILEQLQTRHNKQVELKFVGMEVLVDKVVAQKLHDPLMHLVRNAFDHGIESPSLRQQRGKAQRGEIKICGYHQGKHLIIEVWDDGQGLDFEAIRQRALESQLLDAQQASHWHESQLTDLLFHAGFSTASEVNDLSGRGVGLDVVKAQLQTLSGSVTVYSELNKGSRFVLQIPLSLTIAKLLLCQAGGKTYAILADAIEQILIPQPERIRSWEGGKVLRWNNGTQDRLIPIYQLSKVLDYFSEVPKPLAFQPKHSVIREGQTLPVILIRTHEAIFGLEVDQLMGEQELVIRPLGTIVPPSYIYGSSILADGRLTLVLDGSVLMQYVLDNYSQNNQSFASSHTGQPIANSTQQRLNSSTPTPQLLPASPIQRDFPTRPDLNKSVRFNKLILLVDDSITVRQTLAQTLIKAGYQVVQAKDGCEALKELQNHTDIQLVICDIEMPRMNGFEFLKCRQQDLALAQIPVVILTSRSGEKHRLIATELGATEYITKPFLEHNLLTMVTNVLNKNSIAVTR